MGWVVPRHIIKDEFTNWGTLRTTFLGVYMLLMRYICPLAILAIFLDQMGLLGFLSGKH